MRLPAWLAYGWLLGILLAAALILRGHMNAPPPPPPLGPASGAALAVASPIDPAALARVRPKPGPDRGVAFSVGDTGAWLTAASVIAGCARPSMMVGELDGLVGKPAGAPRGEAVALTSGRGATALPLAATEPLRGQLAFIAGYPGGRPGEVVLRLVGPVRLDAHARHEAPRTVLAWAPVGHTDGLSDQFAGLVGAPVLDGEGRVLALTLGNAPRRGLVYSTTRAALAAALAAARLPQPSTQSAGTVITPGNYGRAADDLRRDLRIAPVACAHS